MAPTGGRKEVHMALPILPDLNLNTDVSGNTCTCCSNNRSLRVVYSDQDGFHVDRGGLKRGCFFICGGKEAEREENARTWEAFQKVISSYGLTIDDVSKLTGTNVAELHARGSRLRLHHFDRITSHAKSMRDLLADSSREPQQPSETELVLRSPRSGLTEQSREASMHLRLDVRIKNRDGSSEHSTLQLFESAPAVPENGDVECKK